MKAEGRSAFVVFVCFLIIGCETQEHADAELGALKKAKDVAAKVNARANTSEASEIGVPECDAYIKNYRSCLADKVPEEKRADLRRTIDEQQKKWQDAVAGGTDTAPIAEQCKSAVAEASTKLAEYGCSF
jgi:hypothetical protein